jgi:hypothetical protein
VLAKDNPARLRSTGRRIAETRAGSPVIVVDDSTSSENMSKIRGICDSNDFIYHGPDEQQTVLDSPAGRAAGEFVTRLSTPGWTIGLARNYVLILATLKGLGKLVMIDDDILLPRSVSFMGVRESPISSSNKYLSRYPFIGARIEGMADDSVLGHLYRRVLRKTQQPRYPSGAYLGAQSRQVAHYFLNCYNEDWIWLYLQTKGRTPATPFEVRQLRFNPFRNAAAKASIQEFGEILWEGVSHGRGDLSRYLDVDFWAEAIERRLSELKPLARAPLSGSLGRVRDSAIQCTNDDSRLAPICAAIFRDYFQRLPAWRTLIESCMSWQNED